MAFPLVVAVGVAAAVQSAAETTTVAAYTMAPPAPASRSAAMYVAPDVAASSARAILHGGTAEAWSNLASALRDLGLTGVTDIESAFGAAMLADENAGTTSVRSVLRDSVSPTRALALPFPLAAPDAAPDRSIWTPVLTAINGLRDVAWVRTLNVELIATLIGAALILTVASSAHRRSSRPARRARPAKVRRRPSKRVDEARALAAQGVSPAEVARRTGLARDAVSAAVRVRSR